MIDNEDICFYFLREYAHLQHFQQYRMFHSQCSLLAADLQGEKAISLPQSPVGGFFTTEKSFGEFEKFLNLTLQSLQVLGIKTLELVQAPGYYPHAVSTDWLEACGFSRKVTDVSHYIPLAEPLTERLHTMEKRKLKKPSAFSIGMETPENLEVIHRFIDTCRAQQGLRINISLERLTAQYEAFPGKLLMFSARKDGALAAAVIVTIPVRGIAYYFLPATHAAFRKESPMVHLIMAIGQYFQSQHFHYLDLGISSIQGQPQTSLIRFKENMGGIKTERVTYERRL